MKTKDNKKEWKCVCPRKYSHTHSKRHDCSQCADIEFMEQSKKEKDWSKEWEKCKVAHIELMDRLEEQSKTPKEEQCDCHCHFPPHNCLSSTCKIRWCNSCIEPKTEEKCCKSKQISKDLVIDCLPKTEDTALNDLTKNIDESKHDYGEDTGECYCFCHKRSPSLPRGSFCVHCKATGVSTSDVKEDSCDTLSPSENKEESMEDRFDAIAYQESVYGNPNYSGKGWEKCKQFIQSEISKAVAKEREELIEIIPTKIPEGEAQMWVLDEHIPAWNNGYKHALREVLSLLNSKKGIK